MSQHIPEPTIARGAPLGMPSGAVYSSSPAPIAGLVTHTPPAQHQQGMGADRARARRALGLIPAQPGGLHPMLTREAPKVRVSPGEVSKTRAELRRARSAATGKEAEMIAAAGADPTMRSDAYKAVLLAARDANDLVAALVRKLAEMESSSVSRPIAVVLAPVREPAEVADEIANSETRYVCLHDGCRSSRPDGWVDEGSMRRDHPSDAEMRQRQQCHVYVLRCDAPLDPLDPEGERIGYVAAVGSDGTTVARAVAAAEDGDERDEKIAAMETMLVEMRAEMAEMRKSKVK